ncbi:sugar phosphate nucleotidyltransferase [Methylococcus sp. ANG]|uniref:sugar phosphate nucleotidyltransferase n=1 Tax=Methylococcus sp. ANG TaxID=3231903 RepID=UPI00345B0A24
MKAVILAGGQGSRLRPLTENIPKPMVAILGRPIMEHIVLHLRRHGFTELLATLHYRPRLIRDHFGDGSEFDVNLTYTIERKPLGTAGSVKLGGGRLDETFLVIAGDALTDFDLAAFWRFHRERGSKVTLYLKRVPDPSEFGMVITDEDSRVLRFLEKPGLSEVFSDTVNTGIYLIEPDVLNEIPDGVPYDFASDLFPKLIERGVVLQAYVGDGYWCDIGTLDQLRQAHWDLLDGKVHLPLGGNRVQDQVWVGEGGRIAKDATLLAPCWIGDNVHIRTGAKIGAYTVIAADADIDVHASLSRTIVMNGAFVGESADLRNCIVGDGTILEAGCEVGDGAVVGQNCHLGRNVVVASGVLVWPEKSVDSNTTIRENLIWESLRRPSIFGSRGISGLANLHITPEYATVLGKAFGHWVQRGNRVVVARDGHPFSRLLKRALICGLLAVGVDVDDLEEISLPETRFITCFGRRVGGGVHIRISDEHPRVAVIELFDAEGLPLTRGVRRKIETVFYRAEFPRLSIESVGSLAYPGRVDDRYLDHLSAHIDREALKPWMGRVLHCCGEDNLSRILASILKSQGLPQFQAEYGESGLPVVPYGRLAEIAKLNHQIVLVIEGSGEKLSLVDEVGNVLDARRTLELLAAAFTLGAPPSEPLFLLPDHPVFLKEMAESNGRRVIVTPKEVAAQIQAVVQGAKTREVWIHFVHFYLGYGAVAAALRLLEFLGRRQMALHDFERAVPLSHRGSLVVPCPWDHMGRVMRELAQMPEARSDSVPEGVRLEIGDDSIYVLPSADAPQLEITLEAATASGLAKLEQEEVNHRIRRLIE